LHPAPIAQQPFECCLQQVLSVDSIPGQRDGRPQELVATFSDEPVQLRITGVPSHAITSPIAYSTAKDE